ncbi:tryptophan halogenase family protein [Streptosporangium sp. CA-135522]|uniref:tryptophan halogenase family protein n=1 Tax=Streptosporangium sp. CA-135522 TaxID=3240072 RepID=UPI003D8B8073
MSKRIVIAGGGTAGWMTASYLQASLGEQVSITLVESPAISTIGVGEATFSTIRHFFSYIGLEEHEWMPACNATYKLGIRFRNWRHPGHDFYHPFERLGVLDGYSMAEWWLRCGPTDRFDRDCFIIANLCDAMRSPHALNGELFEAQADEPASGGRTTMAEEDRQYPYAYHFDAALLADFLMRRSTGQGVHRVVDSITECLRDENGIAGLVTKEHGTIEGDLYIDCTGFRGLLINQALEEPFVSFQEYLPNDRAVALRVPTDIERDGIQPYTTATAMDAGWMWTIPLFGRNGMGYVYSEQFSTPEEAERKLREMAGPAAQDLEANHIRMRIGRSRNSWVKNCVAIGLSSGFVEPLESTGIFFIQHGIEQLVKHLPGGTPDPVLVEHYNQLVARCIDGICEFLAFHYYTAARRDNDYWKATKERALPGDLAERVKLWQSKLPDAGSIYPYYHGFEPYSYISLIMGMGGVPVRQRPVLDLLDSKQAEAEFESIRRRSDQAVAGLPSQYEYFAHMRHI